MTLATIANGALMETATAELRRICENIQDPNTKAEAKRKLKIEILLEPNEKREHANITYTVKPEMPGPDAGKTLAVIAMDPETRSLALFEAYTPQTLFPEPESPAIPLGRARA
jgi:hypothetical protein